MQAKSAHNKLYFPNILKTNRIILLTGKKKIPMSEKKSIDPERERIKKAEEAYNKRLAGKIRNLREQHNYSQEYLSEYLGKSDYSSYGKMENGRTRVSTYDLYKIASLYNIGIEELVSPSYVPKKEHNDEVREHQSPYMYRKNSLSVNIELDGTEDTLDKSLDLIKKVNELLKH
jgi:transcriptional regulator with XRE-family HTH domain